MSRFVIRWDMGDQVWRISERDDGREVAVFQTLAESEAYVIERTSRRER